MHGAPTGAGMLLLPLSLLLLLLLETLHGDGSGWCRVLGGGLLALLHEGLV
jgi:hypothetical protein